MSRIFLIFLSVAVVGCATRYQSEGFSGGFTHTQLAPNMFDVNFSGNGFTSSQRASDFALLRAAELTIGAGYSYFGIMASGTETSHSSFTTPGTATTYVSSTGNYASTTINPGQTFYVQKPAAKNRIVCFNDNPRGDLFDAHFLAKSIRAKYGMRAHKDDDDIEAEILAFSKNPKYPHFSAVRPVMATLLQEGKANTLEEAYAIATKQAGLN